MRLLCFTAMMAVCLTGCFSTSEKKATAPMSEKMSTRFTKPDMTRRSIYEKSMQASLGKKKGIGSWFSGKKHAAKAFTGGKAFAGTRDFKTGSFSGANQQSQMAGQSFSERDKTPSDAGKGFAAGQSRYQDQSAGEASKTFSGADDVFETRADRDALKSQKKNVRPKFVEFEEQKRDPAYTEQQVRRLMGRD